MNIFKKEMYINAINSNPDPDLLVNLSVSGRNLVANILGGTAPYSYNFYGGYTGSCGIFSISTPNGVTNSLTASTSFSYEESYTGVTYQFSVQVTDFNGAVSNSSVLITSTCLIFGTKINTKNGIKNIEHVKEGNFILDKDNTYTKVTSATSHISDSIININNGLLQSTKSHIHIINKDGVINKKQGEFLNIGDNLVDQYGNDIAITSLNIIEQPTNVVNLSTESHTYIANGVLTHNKTACP
jgi:hypothetical protein